jgi:hypothetical protein
MYREIAEESIKSCNPLLWNLKGTVHVKKGKKWVIALSLVKSFLEKYQMENTLVVFSAELGEDKIKSDQESVLSFLGNLMEVRPRLKMSTFGEKLQKFKEDIRYEEAVQTTPLIFTAPYVPNFD